MKRFVGICALLILTMACEAEWPKRPARKHAFLSVLIVNRTGEKIDQAGVSFGEFRCGVGVLGSGTTKTYVDWAHPITTNAIVRWRDGHKLSHAHNVNLVGIYNPKAAGELAFMINATNVAVEFMETKRR